MHEFPEVQALVQQAIAEAEGARVTRLKIIVGEGSGHNPHHIQEHFIEASRGTSAEGAVLEFIPEKLAAKCAQCGAPFSAENQSFACEQCGSTELLICSGKAVRLIAVEKEPVPAGVRT